MANATLSTVHRKPKSSKLTSDDAIKIAELVAMRKMTEKEACIHLNIVPTAWFTWKSRNKDNDIFSNAIVRVRAAKIAAHLENIEDAGFGRNGHRADWRASDRYLERIDPARFNDRLAMLPSETDAIADTLLARMLERAYAGTSPSQSKVTASQASPSPAQVIDVQSTRSNDASPGDAGNGI